MYEEILEKLEKQLSNKDMDKIKSTNIHLGIFSEPYLTCMLEGKKTVESRLSKNKIAPYNQIQKNEIVLVKKSSGNVVAYFTIKDVIFFDLTNISINDIKANYSKYLCVSDDFWDLKKDSNYATLIFIEKIVKLTPFSIQKKGRQTWIKLRPNLTHV